MEKNALRTNPSLTDRAKMDNDSPTAVVHAEVNAIESITTTTSFSTESEQSGRSMKTVLWCILTPFSHLFWLPLLPIREELGPVCAQPRRIERSLYVVLPRTPFLG